MRTESKIGMTVLLLSLSLIPVTALADDMHYQDFVVGDQAVSLGGAYAAVASDPSGLYYNPAGLVDAPDTSLSISANLYGIQDSWVGGGASVLPKDPISKLVFFPSAGGFVQGLGRTDNGQRPFAIGVSVLVPSFRRLSVNEEGDTQDATFGLVRQGYHRAFEDQTLWIGVGGAMRVLGRISFGLAVFVVHRTVQDSASSFVAADFQNGEYRTYRVATMDLSFFNDNLLAELGVKIKLVDGLYLGVAVRSPSLQVYSNGSMRFTRSHADSGNPGDQGFLPTPDQMSVSSETRINGEARAGLAYVIPNLLTLSADVSVHLPVSYTLIQVNDSAAKGALLLPAEITRKLVINGNLGAEVQFLKYFSVGLGAFTDFSSAPAIPDGDALAPALQDVNMFGGTLTLGISSEHTLTRLGVIYTYGSGDDAIAVNSAKQLALDKQNFTKIRLSQSFAYFFVSSTFKY